MAILRVVSNSGARTPGVDSDPLEHAGGQVGRFPHAAPARLSAAAAPQGVHPKSNGQTRPLGIPTLADRAMQALYLLGLDPHRGDAGRRQFLRLSAGTVLCDALDECHKSSWSRRQPDVESWKGISKPASIESAMTGC